MHICNWIFVSVGLATAYDLPANLKKIYEAHKTGKCENVLAKGFDDGDSGSDMGYCGDLDDAIFLYSTDDGGYADMDIDCDGVDRHAGGCSNDGSGQSVTAFQEEVSKYDIEDLNANIHPYVVFGNEDHKPSFEPEEHGMQPLSVMAIVCNDKLHYGIWGDTNGHTSTGEASISLAKLCFPDEDITGDSGHTEKDVMYIGFTKDYAAIGSKANWTAEDSDIFEDSLKSVGDRLVAELGSDSSDVATPSSVSSVLPTSIDGCPGLPKYTYPTGVQSPAWKPRYVRP